MKTCPGDCCEAFCLPYAPDELNAKRSDLMEGDVIADMVIPLFPNAKDGYWYTCRNFDTETRLCRVYDERPQMCRTFPNRYRCACGLTGPDATENAQVCTPGRGAALCTAMNFAE